MTGKQQSNTMITAAKNFSLSAANLCENPPHSIDKWEECQQLWQQAISRLETISKDEVGYLETQALLANYETNSSIIKLRSKAEKESVEALERAKREIQNLQEQFANGVEENQRNLFLSKMQRNIEQLKKVKIGTTSYNEAQELLSLAQAKVKEVTQ